MLKLIARLFDPALRQLAAGCGPVRGSIRAPRPVPVVSRHLLVYRYALPAELVPRRADGPYSQAAYERWQRAENRTRRESRRAAQQVPHGIGSGPRPARDMVVR